MKFLNLSCPQKLYKTFQIVQLFLFSMQLQHNIIKLNIGSIPISNRKLEEQEKLAAKEKNERKNTASANINSPEYHYM